MRNLRESVEIPGTVEATTLGRAVVTPPNAGRVISLRVSLGSRVAKGQIVAVLDSPEVSEAWSHVADAIQSRDSATADLDEARAEVNLGIAKLNAANIQLKRQKEFAKAGAFSQAPLQQAQSDLNDAQSEMLALQKEQATHEQTVDRLQRLYDQGYVSRAELDAAKLELQQDEIKLARARSKVAESKAAVDREKKISDRGLLDAKEIQSAEAEVRAAELELERAKIKVRSMQALVANSNQAVSNAQTLYRANVSGGTASGGKLTLVAPIAGVVTMLNVTQGQGIDRNQAIIEIEDLRSVWVIAHVPESYSDRVKKGDQVRISVNAVPGRDFDGEVQMVGTKLDPKTRTVQAQCLVREPLGMLKSQMFANVHLPIGRMRQALAVPTTSVLINTKQSFVFVQSPHGFLRTVVVTGISEDGYTEIVSGLKQSDKVVSKGAFLLNSELQKGELKGHEH